MIMRYVLAVASQDFASSGSAHFIRIIVISEPRGALRHRGHYCPFPRQDRKIARRQIAVPKIRNQIPLQALRARGDAF
ncbi:hypothetical protein ACFIOY_19740 [Bradyrhizobium sp. TZ2]